MTQNSYICRLINEHPDDWREICVEKKIKVKEQYGYTIFNYDIMADFSDPVVQEARGIILEIYEPDQAKVAAWPFRKFGNSHESYADPIDWPTARVQEKVDGSIIKLWNDPADPSQWRFSSNGCIDADTTLKTGYSLYQLITETKEYRTLQKLQKEHKLNPEYTYIFELVSPKNQIVIKYDTTKLYHLGTRNRKTGEELEVVLEGIEKPKEYPLHSLEDCIKAAEKLNQQKGSGDFPRHDEGGFPSHEGFVVVDGNYNRVKIKSPEYLIYHHMVNNGQINKERAYDLLTSDDFNFDTFMKSAPEYACEAVAYYSEQMSQVKEEIRDLVDRVREMAANGKTRREIAEAIKTEPGQFYAFKALGCEESADQIISDYGKKILGFIKDFQPACGLEENIEDSDEEKDL